MELPNDDKLTSDSISDKVEAMKEVDCDYLQLLVKDRKTHVSVRAIIIINGADNVEAAMKVLQPIAMALGPDVMIGDTQHLPRSAQPPYTG